MYISQASISQISSCIDAVACNRIIVNAILKVGSVACVAHFVPIVPSTPALGIAKGVWREEGMQLTMYAVYAS